VVETAMKVAATVPLGVAEKCSAIGKLVDELKPITNPSMSSDLTVAGALARASITGALANVSINLESIKDQAFVADARRRAALL